MRVQYRLRRHLYANITDPTHAHETKHFVARRARRWDRINRFDDSQTRTTDDTPTRRRQLTAFPMNLLPALNPIQNFTPSRSGSEIGRFSGGTGSTGSRRKSPRGPLRKRIAPCLPPSFSWTAKGNFCFDEVTYLDEEPRQTFYGATELWLLEMQLIYSLPICLECDNCDFRKYSRKHAKIFSFFSLNLFAI